VRLIVEDDKRADDPERNPPRKHPWWVSGATLENSRNMAIWCSLISVAWGVLVIVTGTRNPWTAALCLVWGILAVWAWASVRYFSRRGEQWPRADDQGNR
jgi:hypothetical protein